MEAAVAHAQDMKRQEAAHSMAAVWPYRSAEAGAVAGVVVHAGLEQRDMMFDQLVASEDKCWAAAGLLVGVVVSA